MERIVRVLSKGVIVIPKEIREEADIGEGSILRVKYEGGSIILTPIEKVIKRVDLPYEVVDKIISEARSEELEVEGSS